jgi:putative peptide zinc metalloprotease protein
VTTVIDLDAVPVWPHVAATVRPDGTAAVTIDGTSHRLSAADIPAARAAVIAFIATEAAAKVGRPVRVDTFDPEGEWTLVVDADGSVTETNETPQQQRRHTEPSHTEPATTIKTASTEPPASVAPATAEALTAGPIAVPPSASHSRLPTLTDLLATRPTAPTGPAEWGWQSVVRRLSGGVISPVPGQHELRHRQAVTSVQRSLDGPKTVVVVNPKGGAHKTTAALLIAATFGINRGGYTLAWDNNETRGTLGWRATPARHANTAVDLLHDLERFTDLRNSRVGDLDNYVRNQGSEQFDVLASDEDAASAASIDATAFGALHRTLERFYRVIVVDTGNNMRASNWQAAVNAADQLVIISTVREDTAQSAAWLIDALRVSGNEAAVQKAVTVLSAPSRDPEVELRNRLHGHFGQLTRTVMDVPHDPALVAGGPLSYAALTAASREAWLQVTAAVAEGL